MPFFFLPTCTLDKKKGIFRVELHDRLYRVPIYNRTRDFQR
jgi:hypothetical protein